MLTLPGNVIEGEQLNFLRETVAQICGLGRKTSFPGSQPVSFKSRDLERLQREDYWVCEKSDGLRVLLLIVPFEDGQEHYLIDRKNSYRQLHGLFFPHYVDKVRPLGHSLIDGELVLDKDPATGAETMRLYAFDCLVSDGQNIMGKPLSKRYGRLKEQVVGPFARMLRELPNMAAAMPFVIVQKTMQAAYNVEAVWREDIPKLHHESDGLIYTNAETSYVVGTDQSLLKWKAPAENSIDFKLDVRFPPMPGRPDYPDLGAKPAFFLMAYHGEGRTRYEQRYEYYDMMSVTDAEWNDMKKSGIQYDDRIVEVCWVNQSWRFLRFRDDKMDGNHISVVQNIVESIKDGVEIEEILSSAPDVKLSWKARERERLGQGPPLPPSRYTHPPPAPSHPPPQQSMRSPQWLRPTAKYPEDDIRSSALYSRVSGPRSVDGILR